ncbi:hypothetical protein MPER_02908, partial [Moniliophthora perniciosa FA553]
MARKLWRPATEGDGIPLEVLRTFCQALCDWRTEFFDKVSVHMNDYSGDFVTTVSRFASDAQYHVMWIVLYNAVDEFGVKEANEVHRTSTPPHNIPNSALINDTTRKLVMEAVNSATRISTLRLDKFSLGLADVKFFSALPGLNNTVAHMRKLETKQLRFGKPTQQVCN